MFANTGRGKTKGFERGVQGDEENRNNSQG